MRPTISAPSRTCAAAGIFISLMMLAGCAGNSASTQASAQRINPTLEDAQRQTRGIASGQASTQLHLGFGDTGQQEAQPEAQTQATSNTQTETSLRALAEPRTFLGTIPCPGANCGASRISLTLAPAGHWRARITALGDTQHPDTAQGCWSVVSQSPARIILQNGPEAVLANLSFINDNVLRVNEFRGTQPVLEYRLTRQAEIDPIDELKGKSLPQCKPN